MSKKLPLTDKFIKSIRAHGVREEYSDSQKIGLRLRVGATAHLTFAYCGRGLDGKTKTVTIGDYPSWSLKAAREEAARIRMALKKGEDPNAEKRRMREEYAREKVTLAQLLNEYEALAAATHKIWRNPLRGQSEARLRIEAVFQKLLDRPVSDITTLELSQAMKTYKSRRNRGKKTAHGQTSRARSYLSKPLDWAAGRKSFNKLGAGRDPLIVTPDIHLTHDFSITDPTITGIRERVLSETELQKILPLLRYPAPAELNMKVAPSEDLRPLAMRFILLTAARREEVAAMCWRDVNLEAGTWYKPKVKTTKGTPRDQLLPLSDDALLLLSTLPEHSKREPQAFVFPNSTGGKLDNWDRVNRAIKRESQTEDWHRHDLRRTASQLMKEMDAPVTIIDAILAHSNPFSKAGASKSIQHYVSLKNKIQKRAPAPQKTALDQLAWALRNIEDPRAEDGNAP